MTLLCLSAPCAPQNVSASRQCSNNTAYVSWKGSPGAVGYNVTAVGYDGDVRHNIVTGTSCQLPNMHCSQTYDIIITPFSETCAGFPTAPYTFSAGVYKQFPQLCYKYLSHCFLSNTDTNNVYFTVRTIECTT